MSEELSRVEDLLANGVEEPVQPMSEIEAILRGEGPTPHSRVADLLLKYNPSDKLIKKTATTNGTYIARNDDADGYYEFVVDTPVAPQPTYDQLDETVTENGEYSYTPQHDAFDSVDFTVAVPGPVLGTKTVTENGTYKAEDDNLDGYSQFTANIPVPQPSTVGVNLKYLCYASFTGTDPCRTDYNYPLDVKSYGGYDDYLTYNTYTNEIVVKKNFTAVIMSWCVNYDTASHPAIMGLKLNGNWFISPIRTSNNSVDSVGTINTSFKSLDSQVGIYVQTNIPDKSNCILLPLHVNDRLSIQKPFDHGWLHAYMKIYKLFDSTTSTDDFMGSVITTSDTSNYVNVNAGGDLVFDTLTVTQNGTYNPPHDGYSQVNVQVPSGGTIIDVGFKFIPSIYANTDGNGSATIDFNDSDMLKAPINHFFLNLYACYFTGSTPYTSSTTLSKTNDGHIQYAWTSQSGNTRQYFNIAYVKDLSAIKTLSDWDTYDSPDTFDIDVSDVDNFDVNNVLIDFKNVVSGGNTGVADNTPVSKVYNNGTLTIGLPLTSDNTKSIDVRILYIDSVLSSGVEYNADDLQIATSEGQYITNNFDVPLEPGKSYIGALKDSSYSMFQNVPIFFQRGNGTQYISQIPLAQGVATLAITDTTASLSSYSGDWRNVWLRLSKVLPGQTY